MDIRTFINIFVDAGIVTPDQASNARGALSVLTGQLTDRLREALKAKTFLSPHAIDRYVAVVDRLRSHPSRQISYAGRILADLEIDVKRDPFEDLLDPQRLLDFTEGRLRKGHHGVQREMLEFYSRQSDQPVSMDDLERTAPALFFRVMEFVRAHLLPAYGTRPEFLLVGPGFIPIPSGLHINGGIEGTSPQVVELALTLPSEGRLEVVDISDRVLRAVENTLPRIVFPSLLNNGDDQRYIASLLKAGTRQVQLKGNDKKHYRVVTYAADVTRRIQTRKMDIATDSFGVEPVDLLWCTNTLGLLSAGDGGDFWKNIGLFKMLGTVRVGGHVVLTLPNSGLSEEKLAALGYREIKRFRHTEGASVFILERFEDAPSLSAYYDRIETIQGVARKKVMDEDFQKNSDSLFPPFLNREDLIRAVRSADGKIGVGRIVYVEPKNVAPNLTGGQPYGIKLELVTEEGKAAGHWTLIYLEDPQNRGKYYVAGSDIRVDVKGSGYGVELYRRAVLYHAATGALSRWTLLAGRAGRFVWKNFDGFKLTPESLIFVHQRLMEWNQQFGWGIDSSEIEQAVTPLRLSRLIEFEKPDERLRRAAGIAYGYYGRFHALEKNYEADILRLCRRPGEIALLLSGLPAIESGWVKSPSWKAELPLDPESEAFQDFVGSVAKALPGGSFVIARSGATTQSGELANVSNGLLRYARNDTLSADRDDRLEVRIPNTSLAPQPQDDLPRGAAIFSTQPLFNIIGAEASQPVSNMGFEIVGASSEGPPLESESGTLGDVLLSETEQGRSGFKALSGMPSSSIFRSPSATSFAFKVIR